MINSKPGTYILYGYWGHHFDLEFSCFQVMDFGSKYLYLQGDKTEEFEELVLPVYDENDEDHQRDKAWKLKATHSNGEEVRIIKHLQMGCN